MAPTKTRPVRDNPTWILTYLLIVSSLRASRATRASILVRASVIVLQGAIAAFISIFAVVLVFNVEDGELRYRALTAALCVVTLGWSFSQVILQKPMNFLLDIRKLLPLPFGFRRLRALRLTASLGGWWIVGLGPAIAYAVATRSTGLASAAIMLSATTVGVLIQGQVASILSTQRDRIIRGPIGSIAMLLAMVTLYAMLFLGAAAASEDQFFVDAAHLLRDSPLVTVARYTPPGLVASAFSYPETTSLNLARTAALLVYFLGLMVIDRRLLERSCLVRPSDWYRSTHRTVPLAWLLRRARRLPANACLTLVEVESAARSLPLRWSFLIAAAFLIVGVGDPVLGMVAPLMLACLVLNIHRGERVLKTCRVWSESFALPVGLLDALRAMGRAPRILLLVFLAAAGIRGFVGYRWADWPHVLLGVAFGLSLITAADGAYGWYDARWQTPQRTVGKDMRSGKSLARNAVALGLLVPVAAFTLSYSASPEGPSPLVASVAAPLLLLAAGVTRSAFRRRQRRLVRLGGLDLLLGRSAESALSTTGNNDGEGRHPDGREPSCKHV